jgi:predicted hexulose-6-phosphate isomerase
MNFATQIGIYEKALSPGSWRQMLGAAAKAGFDFVEISVDESAERLARLDWTRAERDQLRSAVRHTGMRVPTLCLSGHRRYGLGSADPKVRAAAGDMLDKAIRLSDDVGIRVIQVAGYFAYYEQPDISARSRFIEGLEKGSRLAAQFGVMLALENIDTADVGSVRDARQLVDEVDSPWFTVYPDVGNIAVNGHDVLADLKHIDGAAVGIHLKDTRLGQPRRVPFGHGVVPFRDVFATLGDLGYAGPFMIEMWNDDPATANQIARDALRWVEDAMTSGGFTHGARAEAGPAPLRELGRDR